MRAMNLQVMCSCQRWLGPVEIDMDRPQPSVSPDRLRCKDCPQSIGDMQIRGVGAAPPEGYVVLETEPHLTEVNLIGVLIEPGLAIDEANASS